MSLAQYIFVYIVFSLAAFVASRAAVWNLLIRFSPSREKKRTDEVLAICGSFGVALSLVGSAMLFLDGYGFVVVTLAIVGGHLVWPVLMYVIAIVALSGDWAIGKLDSWLRRTFGNINE